MPRHISTLRKALIGLRISGFASRVSAICVRGLGFSDLVFGA